MQLSETVEWGIHACLALAMIPKGSRIPTKALADYHGIKPSYFAKAMQKLVAAGIIKSVEGRAGGLRLIKCPSDISVLEIVLALEENKTFFQCREIRQQGPCAAKSKYYSKPCNIAHLMHKADAAWRRVLAQTSLNELCTSAMAEPIPGVNEATQEWLTEFGALRGL
jgi:Rrf2 family protein